MDLRPECVRFIRTCQLAQSSCQQVAGIQNVTDVALGQGIEQQAGQRRLRRLRQTATCRA